MAAAQDTGHPTSTAPATATHKTKWIRAQVVRSDINVIGGYNAIPMPATGIELMEGEKLHTWVALDKNAKWFMSLIFYKWRKIANLV